MGSADPIINLSLPICNFLFSESPYLHLYFFGGISEQGLTQASICYFRAGSMSTTMKLFHHDIARFQAANSGA